MRKGQVLGGAVNRASVPVPSRWIICLACLTWTLASAPCTAQTVLACGRELSGAVDNAGKVDTYQFGAAAGDAVTIRIARTWGDLDTYMELLDPGGARIGSSGKTLDAQLRSAGSYTLVVSDYYKSKTGGYKLVWQKLNAPCGATAASCGRPITATISAAAEFHFYTMTVAAGDAVTIHADRSSGEMTPYMELYSSDGQKVYSDYDYVDRVLTAGGTYTLIVSDRNWTRTGTYSLVWQRLNAPCDASILTCGQALRGTIRGPAQHAFYAFTAAANDAVTIRAAASAGDVAPYVELYSFSGKRIASADSGVVDATLPDVGIYSVIVSDRSAKTGEFSLVFQKLNAPCNAVPLSCGEAGSGTIASRGQYNFHSLTADKGDAITLRVSRTGGEIDGKLEFYAPDGERLSVSNSTVDRVLTATGTYTLVLSDSNRVRTGGYSLVWQKLNAPCKAVEVPCGQPVRGAIARPAQYDFYTITVASGDAVTIRLRGLSGKLDDYLELYAPDGSRVGSEDSAPLDKVLAAGGTYTLIVSDYYLKESGAYLLVWQKLNAPCNAATLSCGQVVSASIANGAQVVYTLDAAPGDAVSIRTAATSGSLSPYLELYGSQGSRIDWGRTIAARLPEAGPFTLIVRDSSVTRAGTYGLVWQKRNGPCGARLLACGQAASGAIRTPLWLDAYAFEASAGDQLRVQSRYWAGSSYLYLELYDLEGNNVAIGSDSLQATLAAGGWFGLLVGPTNRTDTGRYSVSVNRANDPCPLLDHEPPQVTLSSPRGGEVLLAGSRFRIAWKAADNDQVSSQQIKLSTDGGQTFSTVIADGLDGSRSTFEWTIPEGLSTPTARIQVTAVDSVGLSGAASSAGNFAILGFALPDAKKTTYQYDPLGRLTKVVYSDGSSITYEYDAVGNITRITKTGASQSPAAKDDD